MVLRSTVYTTANVLLAPKRFYQRHRDGSPHERSGIEGDVVMGSKLDILSGVRQAIRLRKLHEFPRQHLDPGTCTSLTSPAISLIGFDNLNPKLPSPERLRRCQSASMGPFRSRGVKSKTMSSLNHKQSLCAGMLQEAGRR